MTISDEDESQPEESVPNSLTAETPVVRSNKRKVAAISSSSSDDDLPSFFAKVSASISKAKVPQQPPESDGTKSGSEEEDPVKSPPRKGLHLRPDDDATAEEKSETDVKKDGGSREKLFSSKKKGVSFVDSSDDEVQQPAHATENNKVSTISSVASTSKKGIVFDDSSDEEEKKEPKKVSNNWTFVNHHNHERQRRPRPKRQQRNHRKKRRKRGSSSDEERRTYSGRVYDSDESDTDVATADRVAVASYFNHASFEELLSIPGCRTKTVDAIINLRPFKSWKDLLKRMRSDKLLSTDLLNGAQDVMNMRTVVTGLMIRCEKISTEIRDLVSGLLDGTAAGSIKVQPPILNPKMHLTDYQMLGLNWLTLLHRQNLNGILADEMGLGKTIQAIAFLSHLLDEGDQGPHLIVVPSSTLENWVRELHIWCKNLQVLVYYGSQAERMQLRREILRNNDLDFQVIVTTYNMVTSNNDDKKLLRRIEFHYVVFDEAHMLKNVMSIRYQALMRIRARRRLLLTGTPLQNNLTELMSLLMFVVPDIFHGKTEEVKQMFSRTLQKNDVSDETRTEFEKERIEHAKRIMRPFVLRRLKQDVLKELPAKVEEVVRVPFSDVQRNLYDKLVVSFSKKVKESKDKSTNLSGSAMMMELRKLANHPLLVRSHYDDTKLKKMAALMLKEPTHVAARKDLILEDMQLMSDFELHALCNMYKSVRPYKLEPSAILNSGKFNYLDEVLPTFKEKGDRVLLFSQFVMVLDVMVEYMKIRGYNFLRLDGQTNVSERQALIDKFSLDPTIFIFLLSTRAGGLGINLTAANTVILHDMDFNPYNDKQAEDRCHRVGQTREVTVYRLVSSNSIDEGILACAQEKLKLERDLTTAGDYKDDHKDVAKLLKAVLGLDDKKS